MVSSSKILTVSYGTYSCTLEGFDDPFSTMKQISEYFRDLAAQDRYFGAEPPTPDAQMLNRIAEREVKRRVEARVNENAVILRQIEAEKPAPRPVQSPVAQAEDTVTARILRIHAASDAAAAALADDENDLFRTAPISAAFADIEDVPLDPPATPEAPVMAEITPEIEPEAEIPAPEADAEVAPVSATDADIISDIITAEAPEPEPAEAPEPVLSEPVSATDADIINDIIAAESPAAEIAPEAEPEPEPAAPALSHHDLAQRARARVVHLRRPPEPAANADARAALDITPPENDAAVSRLMAETDRAMSNSEGTRRRSVIDHLKAAVFSAKAEPEDGDKVDAKAKAESPYRDDLEQVVKSAAAPKAAEGARRLAPLMLVSEQRIDLPQTPSAPLRPQRVSTGNLALYSEIALDGESDLDSAPSPDFSRHVAQIKVADLTDLVEAAAAYITDIEGRPHFSRQRVMRMVAHESLAADVPPKDLLRAFGNLLRNGHIRKLRRGQFIVTEETQFRTPGAIF